MQVTSRVIRLDFPWWRMIFLAHLKSGEPISEEKRVISSHLNSALRHHVRRPADGLNYASTSRRCVRQRHPRQPRGVTLDTSLIGTWCASAWACTRKNVIRKRVTAALRPDREIEFNCSNTAFSTLTWNTTEDQVRHLVHWHVTQHRIKCCI